ncbi:MAG: hypothetical protein AAF682_32350 [Planctomycetota bacterium]
MRRRPPLWLLLVPLATAAGLLGVGVSQSAAAREPDEVLWIHPVDVRLDAFPDWADPRWALELDELFASWPAFRADDALALEAFGEDLASISFLRDVERPAIDAAGTLRLGFRLRRPVAALRAGERFLTVDRDGVLLSGAWPAPPRVRGSAGDAESAGGWLPLIDPGSDDQGQRISFDAALPGDWLVEPAHLCALEVADSLDEHLGRGERDRLGRVVINAEREPLAGPEEPGVLLLLEDERLVLFGRGPRTAEPGELPVEHKWRSVSAALALLAAPDAHGDASAWDLLDARWDVPELRFRGEAAERVHARTLPPELPPLEPSVPASWRESPGFEASGRVRRSPLRRSNAGEAFAPAGNAPSSPNATAPGSERAPRGRVH